MKNVFKESTKVSKEEREELLKQKSRVVWFTGLSGSGKSTLGKELEKKFHSEGKLTYLLDGDNLRFGLNSDLNFSKESRAENIRRVREVAKILYDSGVIIIVTLVSPIREERDEARKLFNEDFYEIYINTPLSVCEERDVKGLYKKARNGEINDFTGISSTFEEPLKAELEIDTSKISIKEGVEKIYNLIEKGAE